MAPTRLASKSIGVNDNLNGIPTHGITTRSKQLSSLKAHNTLKVPNKRKADSPLKDVTAKRAAFGDITNAFNKSSAVYDKTTAAKKITVESKLLPTLKSIKPQPILNGKAPKALNGKQQLQMVTSNAIKSVQKRFAKDPPKPVGTRAQNGILKNVEKKTLANKENQNQSNGSNKSTRSDVSGEPSLYMTALENVSPTESAIEEKAITEKLDQVNLDDYIKLDPETEKPHETPHGVPDFDKENWNDHFQVSNYAMDIFNYLRNRESVFVIDDYLSRMKGITSWMRALLVDWMVEVQESFELNHETLYLAVKLVDIFLTKSSKTQPEEQHLTKEELQLLGASSLFIACKYDERLPPLVDDFLYICDGAYSLSQLLKMEMTVLRVVDFDLGVPLSYRFLRRYARCTRVSMPTLTLARFVLEQCLLEYSLIELSDSKMAAGALYLALRMKSLGHWTPTLQYYTGYTLDDILPVAFAQNAALHKKPRSATSTVRNKYSHAIFFEVAKVPLIDDDVLRS